MTGVQTCALPISANCSVSLPPFCPPSWNLYSDLCKTLTGYVLCHSARLKKKRCLYLKPFSWRPQTQHTDTYRDRQIHTHTHTRRYVIGEMQGCCGRFGRGAGFYRHWSQLFGRLWVRLSLPTRQFLRFNSRPIMYGAVGSLILIWS